MLSLSSHSFCMPPITIRSDTCVSSNSRSEALNFRKKFTPPNRLSDDVPIRRLTCRASCTPVETHNFRNVLSLSSYHPSCGPMATVGIACGTSLSRNGSHTFGTMFTLANNHPFRRPSGGVTCLAGRSASAKARRSKNKRELGKKEAFDKEKAEKKAEKARRKREKKGGGKSAVRVVKKVKTGKKKKAGGKVGASKKRKRNQVLFKLVSTADTNFHYLTTKNRKNHMGEKINLRKYDPVIRRHVLFMETKM